MSSMLTQSRRVLSGMRPTGRLHLGHYYGVLKNWQRLQHEFDSFFFVADWHALTTHYNEPGQIENNIIEMAIDWFAAGINPELATIFVQSWVPEHAELNLLLSMITPLSWLERMPTYKEQQQKLIDRDLNTYGFLGYPLLQSADVLIYRAHYVPVGEDQVPHIEVTREVARRFNHLYGREPGYEALAEAAVAKLGKKNAQLYRDLLRRYQQDGQREALETAQAILHESQSMISLSDQERLLGYLEGRGKIILPEPEALLTETAKMPGLDGQKMSKSYHNTVALRDTPEEVTKKIRTMPTDPARVRRVDPGDPDKCPVWQFHRIYSSTEVKEWVQKGCKTAGIGCLECKQPVIDAINQQLAPMQEIAKEYAEDPVLVKSILAEGSEEARKEARETLDEVKAAMHIDY